MRAKEESCSRTSNMLLHSSLIAFLFILALPHVSAANNTMDINAYYYTGDSFKYKDDVYLVDVNSDYEVVLSSNNQYIVIRNATCVWKNVYYEFCADGISYDSGKRMNKVFLEINSYEQDISVTRTITNSNPLVGEKVNFTVIIKNEGYSNADNITYTDVFPLGINLSVPNKYHYDIKVNDRKVTMSNGSVSSMKYIVWQGNLKPDESIRFVYEITALKPVEDTLTGRFHYTKAFKGVDDETTQIAFKADPYFDIYTNIVSPDFEITPGTTDPRVWEEKSLIYAGEYVLLVVNLVDRYADNSSMNVSDIRFFLPEGVIFVKEFPLKIYDNASDAKSSYRAGDSKLERINDHLYRWSGTVLKGGKFFALKLRAADKGEQNIRVTADVKKDNMPMIQDYSVTKKFSIGRNDIQIESNLKDGDRFNSGQTVYMTLYVTNPNTYTNFTDMNISYNIPWYENGTKNAGMIKEANYLDIINANVKMPAVTYTTTFKYYVNVSYNTGMGERLNKTFSRTVVVTPPPNIQVMHEIGSKVIQDSGSADIDDKETEIILKVNNRLEKDIESVLVTEVFDSRLNSMKEISNRVVLLKKGEATEVYKYNIKPPQSSRWQNFTLRTYVAYASEGNIFNNSFDVQVNVRPKMMDIEVTKSKLETEISRGQLVHIQYKIKNTEKETISNVTLHFPLQYDADEVGARTFSIKQILPGETVVVNEEMIRAKSDSTILIDRTNVTFNDMYGDVFNKSSNSISTSALESYVETPLIFADKAVEQNVVVGEKFITNLTVRNDGGMKTIVTIEDSGNTFSFLSDPGSIASFIYNSTVDYAGYVQASPALLYYDVEGVRYYTASNRPDTYSKNQKPEAPQIAEEQNIGEQAPAIENKKGINTKYIYLALLIIAACLVIWYILNRKPKERGFNFLGE
ncbi:MAG: hypothetical protein NT001_07005 [Candidatus Woesearchaeota archaeon]|nr:hypothetical protein [Candidatus Woesearchaeota archaeon]